jgi:hypothetical protein
LKGADVIVDWHVRPVFAKNLLTEWFVFYELDGFYSANPAGSQRKAANAAEGVNHPQGHCRLGWRDRACSHTITCHRWWCCQHCPS